MQVRLLLRLLRLNWLNWRLLWLWRHRWLIQGVIPFQTGELAVN